MDDKIKGAINNICTILGGALLLYPLIDEATKTIIPQIEKLTSGEATEGLKMLPSGQEKQPQEKEERQERKEQSAQQEDQEPDKRERHEC